MTGRSVFRPPLWATLVTPVVVSACLTLGFWQLGRGDEKTRLRDQLADAQAPTDTLTALSLPDPDAIRRVRAVGTYLPERTLLLDGQSHAAQAGYRIWTPLRLDDGALVIVDRGWLPRAQGATPPPPPEGAAQVAGHWRTLPEPGLRLADSNPCLPDVAFPATVLYPTAAQIECLLGERIVPGLLLLDPALSGGFVRAWTHTGVPPERHYAYAVQWFALAALAAALYVFLNRKRTP